MNINSQSSKSPELLSCLIMAENIFFVNIACFTINFEAIEEKVGICVSAFLKNKNRGIRVDVCQMELFSI